MEIRYWFLGWKKQQIFWGLLLFFAVLVAVLVSLNVGTGTPKIVFGKVIAIGVDTSTRYELPKPLITVELENGKKVIVDGNRSMNVRTGDIVEISERKRLITSGAEYHFLNVKK